MFFLQVIHQFNVTRPVLKTAFVVLPTSPFDGGDRMNFSIVVRHEWNSSRAAHQLRLRADLSSLDPSTVLETLTCSHVRTAAAVFQNSYLVVIFKSFATDDGVLTCFYSAPISESIRWETIVEWEVVLTYYSAATRGCEYNDLSRTLSTESLGYQTSEVVLVAETFEGASLPITADQSAALYGMSGLAVVPWEVVYFAVRVTFPEAVTNMSVHVELLDDDTSLGIRVNAEFTGNARPLGRTELLQLSNHTWKYDLNAVGNEPDNVADSNDVLSLSLAANIGNASVGSLHRLRWTLNYFTGRRGEENVSSLFNVTVVQPRLQLSAVANNSILDAGDVIYLTLTASHTDASTAPAYNVTVTILSDQNYLRVSRNDPVTYVVSTSPLDLQLYNGYELGENLSLSFLPSGNVTFTVALVLTDDSRPGSNVVITSDVFYEDAGEKIVR